MHYLIDGHNLIAKLPDIDLDDPNDEIKLVLRLKSWSSAGRKRRVTVIFDRGLPGGKSLHFSSNLVKVFFASSGSTADDLLIRRIRRAKNPAEFTLVSSDQEILSAARSRAMRVMRAEAFVDELGKHSRRMRPAEESSTPDEVDEPQISEEEVAEWLELFGPAPERKPPKPKSRAKSPRRRPSQAGDKKPRRRPFRIDKSTEQDLEADEVDQWLDLFRRDKK